MSHVKAKFNRLYKDKESKAFKSPSRADLLKVENDWGAKVPSSQYYRPKYSYLNGHVPAQKMVPDDPELNEGKKMK